MKLRVRSIVVALIEGIALGAIAGDGIPVMGTAWYPEMWPVECRANDLGRNALAGEGLALTVHV